MYQGSSFLTPLPKPFDIEMKIILFQPQIPQNTGNIARTCAVTGSSLSLVRPLGFSTSQRQLKRSGLDFWGAVDVSYVDDLEGLLEKTPYRFHFFSSKATKSYTQLTFESSDLLIFGSETAGLPPHFMERWPQCFATIPMVPGVRCLNLATAVGIVIYEAWRQQQFIHSNVCSIKK